MKVKIMISKWKYIIVFSVVIGGFLSACSDPVEPINHLLDCENHYRAESYQVASHECAKAAKEGSSKAQWLMANLYRFNLLGKGEDLKTAFSWYLKAAKKGHVSSMREAGLAYMYASGVNEDLKAAYYWLLKAAKKRDASAEFSIGTMYFEGKGRDKDIGSAINWFKKAGNQQHTMSINNLAWVFATSNNKAFRNPKKAAYWIGKMDQDNLLVPMFLDTKAAVLAAKGKFDQAVEIENLAIAKLPDETAEDELLEYQKHLESYQKREAWNE